MNKTFLVPKKVKVVSWKEYTYRVVADTISEAIDKVVNKKMPDIILVSAKDVGEVIEEYTQIIKDSVVEIPTQHKLNL